MLDFGWSELLVIAIVLIVVVGPKDLPRMLRTFAKTTKKMRVMAGDFRKQFDDALSEAELSELRDTFNDAKKLNPTNAIKDALNPLKEAGNSIKKEIDSAGKSIAGAATGAAAAGVGKADAKDKAGDAELPAFDVKLGATPPDFARIAEEERRKAAHQAGDDPGAMAQDATPAKPAAKKPSAKKPAAKKAAVEKPAASKPAATKSATKKPATRKAKKASESDKT